MGSTSSKPFQISLSDIIEKVRCYSACCVGQVIIEELNDTKRQENSGEDFDIIKS